MCLFGFMDFLVVAKWNTDYTADTNAAPGIIILMLDMAFMASEPSEPGFAPILGTIDEQYKIMHILMMTVVICIPLMLCIKPIYLLGFKKSSTSEVDEGDLAHGGFATGDDDFVAAAVGEGKVLKVSDDPFRLSDNVKASYAIDSHGEDGAVEILIHQGIEVIEFVLGTISNTASYLRLWALSLAHSQLAKVFYDQCLMPGFESNNVILLFIAFFVFMGATAGVLMCMDVMECFLHTLRLHWVEFMSKFYKGEGLKYSPVSLKDVLLQPQYTQEETS
jgi:V-type H+-transporting ATPase subunit a